MHEERTPAARTAFGALLVSAAVALVVMQDGPALPAEAPPPPLSARDGRGPSPPDRFHPDRDQPLAPRHGGTVTVHLETPLNSLNGLLEIAEVTFRVLDELHAPLVQRDWETWEFHGVLAERIDVEDTLELQDGSALFGRVEEGADHVTVTPLSDLDHVLSGPRRIPRDQVRDVLPGTVYTFHLRDDVLWHDGHPLDADDVLFTWRCTKNPHVRCDATRSFFDNMVRAERAGDGAVRFFLERPHFLSMDLFSRLVIQPAHLYDLSDPDNPDHDPGAGDEKQGRFVNEHPANQHWIGLGPYRVVARDDQVLRALRFDGY
jgi:ABC-type transport system substrate-binding protein